MGTRLSGSKSNAASPLTNLERTAIDLGGIAQPGHRAVRRSFAPARPERMGGVRVGMVCMGVGAGMRAAGAYAFHVVVVARLRQAHLVLEAGHRRTVFAQSAIHRVVAVNDLVHARSIRVSTTFGWSLRYGALTNSMPG